VAAAFLMILVLGIGSLASLQCAQRPKPNVLFITMDSLRWDHLGCYGYQRAKTPNIDHLAEQGVLFVEAISQAPYTHISVPSIITGKYPLFTGVRSAGVELDSSHATLAELLNKEGYLTCIIPMKWKKGLTQGFEILKPGGRSTIEKTQFCLEALGQLDDRPFFIWLYYWDPHLPYHPPVNFIRDYEPDYTREVDKPERRPSPAEKDEDLRDETGLYAGTTNVLTRVNQGKIALTRAERDHLINLYDAEIAFVDSKIKEVVAKLKELGLWDNTMVILNADHGEAFGEHGRYYHGHTLHDEQVRVPLIVKPPRPVAEGKVVSGPVRNLDIMPTILDYCGIPAPADIQGQSLRPFMESDLSPNLPACLETFGRWRGIGSEFQQVGYRRDGYKLICDLVAGNSKLYHLDQDPGETNDLLAVKIKSQQAQRREAELLEDLLKTLYAEQLLDLRISSRHLKTDQATFQRLKALGYVY
jgi:arylsulfatase A-like enzyme